MLTTLKKYLLPAVVVASTVLVMNSRDAAAADHLESPSFGGLSWYFLNARNDAVMLDVLDYLGIEPLDPRDGPMPQTREHILLARVTRSDSTTQQGGPLELQLFRLTRRQARRVIWILLLLEDHHDPDPAAVYFIRYLRQTKTSE